MEHAATAVAAVTDPTTATHAAHAAAAPLQLDIDGWDPMMRLDYEFHWTLLDSPSRAVQPTRRRGLVPSFYRQDCAAHEDDDEEEEEEADEEDGTNAGGLRSSSQDSLTTGTTVAATAEEDEKEEDDDVATVNSSGKRAAGADGAGSAAPNDGAALDLGCTETFAADELNELLEHAAQARKRRLHDDEDVRRTFDNQGCVGDDAAADPEDGRPIRSPVLRRLQTSHPLTPRQRFLFVEWLVVCYQAVSERHHELTPWAVHHPRVLEQAVILADIYVHRYEVCLEHLQMVGAAILLLLAKADDPDSGRFPYGDYIHVWSHCKSLHALLCVERVVFSALLADLVDAETMKTSLDAWKPPPTTTTTTTAAADAAAAVTTAAAPAADERMTQDEVEAECHKQLVFHLLKVFDTQRREDQNLATIEHEAHRFLAAFSTLVVALERRRCHAKRLGCMIDCASRLLFQFPLLEGETVAAVAVLTFLDGVPDTDTVTYLGVVRPPLPFEPDSLWQVASEYRGVWMK